MTVAGELRITQWMQRELATLERRFDNHWSDFKLDKDNKKETLYRIYKEKATYYRPETGTEKAVALIAAKKATEKIC